MIETDKLCEYLVGVCRLRGAGWDYADSLKITNFYDVVDSLLKNGVGIEITIPKEYVSKTFSKTKEVR